jgi:exopolysaccharide biosynthesis polyprenyl glycosylphosphotransferase
MLKLPKYKYFLAILDFIVLVSSFLLADMVTDYYKYVKTSDNMLSFYVYLAYFLFSLVFILIFQFNNLYKIDIVYKIFTHLKEISRSLFTSIVLLLVFSYLFNLYSVLDSRFFILSFSIISFFLLVLYRIVIMRKLVAKFNCSLLATSNIIIMGGGAAGKLLATKILYEKKWGYNLVGFIDDNLEIGQNVIAQKSVLGSFLELEDLVLQLNLDEMIIAIDNITYSTLIEILDAMKGMNIKIKLATELFDIVPDKVQIEMVSNIPLIEASSRIDRNFNIHYKRVFDLITTSFGLLLLSPFFLLIGILIKLSSKGPIFYSQKRIGKNGKPFKFYKFRSMKTDISDEKNREEEMINFIKNGDESSDKIINNSRVTRIGKFIRKTSLDELPQLFNVIKGDMSLVGPRPCLKYEYDNYEEWQRKRLEVLPGCTGVWQVFGRSQVSFKNSVILDLYYISNMSPWLDLQLILQTIPVMVLSRGGK